MDKNNSLIKLTLTWFTGLIFLVGGVIIVVYLPELNALGYTLITTGSTVMLGILGLDIGLNLIPHLKNDAENLKLELVQKKKFMENCGCEESAPSEAKGLILPEKTNEFITQLKNGLSKKIEELANDEEKKEDNKPFFLKE